MIDTHVHLDAEKPLSPDLSEVLYYHNYLAEIISAGATAALASNRHLGDRERVRNLAPEIGRSRCSTHAWMLREVLRGAYGFEGEITEKSWESLFEKAEQARSRPGRMREICRTAGISKILVHLPAKPPVQTGGDSSIFVGLSDLQIPSVPTKTDLASFENQTGASVRSAQQMRESALSHFMRAAKLGQRGLRIDIRPELVLRRPGDAAVEAAFERSIMARQMSEEDAGALMTFSLDTAASSWRSTGDRCQIFLDGWACGGHRIPSSSDVLAKTLWEFVAGHPQASFEVYTMSAGLTRDALSFLEVSSNLSLGGTWWYCQFPEIMSSTYSLRLEMLPASKWSAFFSDAYVAEWIIGKAALTRKEIARSLAGKVLDGYLSEEDALGTARAVLYETPCRLYRLPARAPLSPGYRTFHGRVDPGLGSPARQDASSRHTRSPRKKVPFRKFATRCSSPNTLSCTSDRR